MHIRVARRGRNGPSFVLASLVAACASLATPNIVHAQFVPGADAATAAREQRRQEERINAIRQQQERGADVRRPAGPAADPTRLPEGESPCFPIERLTLKGDERGEFAWLAKAAAGPQGDDAPQGRCLGGQGINLVLKRLQNALIARGYITSRVAAEPQDLRTGELVLTLTPGRLQDIRLAPDSPPATSATRLSAAIPGRTGDVLNLRDIEQGLENLKSVPTADADIKIVPAEQEGRSDLVVAYRQGSPLRGTVSVDDSGTKATGKYQGSVTAAYDNPAGLNDLLYASLNHDLGLRSGRGTKGGLVHYSVPFGYWNASATYDRAYYHQTIAGATQNYVYSGRNSNAEIKLSRVVRRDGNSKTVLAAGAFQRRANNYIDDTEVEVQRRRTGGWLATLNHRHFLGAATFDASLGYKRGTGAFGSITAPEEAFGEGSSHFEIVTADIVFTTPFTLADKRFRYLINLRGQQDQTRLAPPERFIIGGRYTVRGFDGEMILSAERGWFVRNDISTPIAAGMEAYLGLDHGLVSGPSADLLIGRRLTGAVVGARGSFQRLRYDVFVGAPLHKPAGFKTAGTTAGFSVSVGF
jgi:hemolysin activation/secretion protein